MGITVALLQLIHNGICSISGLYPHLHPQPQLKLRPFCLWQQCAGTVVLHEVPQGPCMASAACTAASLCSRRLPSAPVRGCRCLGKRGEEHSSPLSFLKGFFLLC